VPVTVAAATAALAAGAQPAYATTHDNGCTEQICLYYSAGLNSARWQRNYSFVYSNFSYNCYLMWHKLASKCYYASFSGDGNGGGTGVRNNARSGQDHGFSPDYVYYYPEFQGAMTWLVPGQPAKSLGIVANENASYKSAGCSFKPPGCSYYIC